MIRSLLTIRHSPIQRIWSNPYISSNGVQSNIFKISSASQARHLTTKKKKITAEKLEKLEKNLEDKEYVENPEQIIRPTKLLAKLTAIHREKWHLKQKPKDPENKISANKLFKMTPIDQHLLKFIQTEKLAMQRYKKRPNNRRDADDINTPELTPSDKFFLKKLRLVYSASKKEELPPKFVPEVAFVGRSNVGKSSLINAIANSKIVRTSPKPGETRAANFYSVGDRLLLVDLPGYGFAYAGDDTKSAWQQMIYHYLSERSSLKKTLLLIDSRVPIKQADKQMFAYFDEIKSKFQVVMTKTDLVTADDLARRHYLLLKELKKYKYALPEVFMLSSYTGAGISRLRGHLGGIAMTDLQIRQLVKKNQEKEELAQQQKELPSPEEEKQEEKTKHKEKADKEERKIKPKKEKKTSKKTKHSEL
jgi:ribosome biogenesis GTP-binding protein YsxC/EngB